MRITGSQLFIHITGWMLCFALVAGFISSGRNEIPMPEVILSAQFLLFAATYIVIFYTNLHFLLPVFFIKKRYAIYLGSVLVLLLLVFYIKPFEQLIQAGEMHGNLPEIFPGERGTGYLLPFPPREPGNGPSVKHLDIVSLLFFLATWAVSTIIFLSYQWRLTEKNKALIETEKAHAQLSFLKAQISPHFLFNTLNNIYALVLTKNENTADGILRLSNIMRYVTDGANEDFVPVKNEIACINDFIELQKLRLSSNINFSYEVAGSYDNIRIAPLLLIAFIENVFKHGISNHNPSDIQIKIDITESAIHLFTQNEIHTKNTGRPGVGLKNAVSRLKLLYAGKYKLETKEQDGKFIVNLFLYR